MALGRLLAPHLERGATRALTHISGQSSLEASSQLKIGTGSLLTHWYFHDTNKSVVVF
jgi:hypothetical protein